MTNKYRDKINDNTYAIVYIDDDGRVFMYENTYKSGKEALDFIERNTDGCFDEDIYTAVVCLDVIYEGIKPDTKKVFQLVSR